jgi:hypothetical protein
MVGTKPHLIKNLEEKFEDMVRNLQTYRTPGTPNQGIVRPMKGEIVEKANEDEHTLYRSGVGMLLYLVKHSRPDIANAVRELSKMMDGPTPAAMKELKRVIKFVLDTQDYGLKLEPEKMKDNKWILKVYTDSDWAGDKNTRLSVTGYVLFLMNVPILWKSKAQKSLALSSSEAEYYALSEAAKDITFVHMLLTSMGMQVILPIVVKVDNVGAIFMTENISTAGRTKHLDLRTRYVNTMAEEGFIKFEFVRSAQNKSDHLTKNVTGEIYEAHVNEYVRSKRSFEQMEMGMITLDQATEETDITADVTESHAEVNTEAEASGENTEAEQEEIIFRNFLMSVAEERHVGRSLREKWIDKVLDKVLEIDITSVSDVVINILYINRRLARAGKTPMFIETLKIMHAFGLVLLLKRRRP